MSDGASILGAVVDHRAPAGPGERAPAAPSERAGPCGRGAAPPPNPLVVALVTLLAIVLIYSLASFGPGLAKQVRDGFASQRAYEVHAQARDLFAKTPKGPTYSEYKTKVAGSDVVQWNDVKKLWEAGKLSPESVEAVL